MSPIFVASPRLSSLRRALNFLAGSPFTWVYLGRDVNEFRSLERLISERGLFLDTTDLVYRTAERLREPYYEYVYQMGKALNSLRWWVSIASHRGCYTSWTFHQACCLRAALDLISSWSGTAPLLVISADEPVRLALGRNLPGKTGVKVCGLPRWSILMPVVDVFRMVLHRIAYLVRESCRLIVARYRSPEKFLPSSPVTLLISPVDAAALAQKGHLSEAYFGNLAVELSQQDRTVVQVPFVSRGLPYQTALKRLQLEAQPTLIPHRWLGVRDLLWTVAMTLLPPPRLQVMPRLDGMDVEPLMAQERRLDWISNWCAEGLLMAALVRCWAAAEVPIHRIIYLYENNPWERALCWAARELLPETFLVAYQHSRLPQYLLKFFLAPGEETIQPQPHRIVTAGSYNAQMLGRNGHSPARIRVGGGLRSQGLLSRWESSPGLRQNGGGRRILVLLQMEWEDTVELLDCVDELFVNDKTIQIMVRPHPLLPSHEIEKRLGRRIPADICASDQPLSDLLLGSAAALYVASTACIEAMSLEIPTVHVRPRFVLDTDPLEHARDARLEATGAKELREKIHWLLEHREEYVAQQREQWRTLVREMFGPVTEETYLAFVE